MPDVLLQRDHLSEAREICQGPWYPSEMIRYANIDGLCVILDMVTENYFILNEQATAIWNALVDNTGEPEGLQRMQLQENAQRWPAFIDECMRRNFLVSKQASSPPCPRLGPLPWGGKRFLVFRAWTSLLYTACSLRAKGFSWTYKDYAHMRPVEKSPDAVKQRCLAEAAFLGAENLFWYPRAPHDCLPRSLALFRFLRGLGLPVVHRIGGRRVPTFFMHAWVEHDGVVILDDPRNALEFTVLASITP